MNSLIDRTFQNNFSYINWIRRNDFYINLFPLTSKKKERELRHGRTWGFENKQKMVYSIKERKNRRRLQFQLRKRCKLASSSYPFDIYFILFFSCIITYSNKTQKLGSGTYGSVFKAVSKITKEPRAIKAIAKNKVKDPESFKNEIEIMRKLVNYYLPHFS